ncbi:MAG: glycine cleavage system protein R [bacterium]
MHQLMSIFGKDRAGLVAGMTRLLYEHRANLGDLEMTRLGGIFALLVEFQLPKEQVKKLERAIKNFARDEDLKINLVDASPYEDSTTNIPPNTIISIYGADRPGIVCRVTELLAERDINISNLETNLDDRDNLYLMILEAQKPDNFSLSVLDNKLQQIAKELGISIKVRPLDPPRL